MHCLHKWAIFVLKDKKIDYTVIINLKSLYKIEKLGYLCKIIGVIYVNVWYNISKTKDDSIKKIHIFI